MAFKMTKTELASVEAAKKQAAEDELALEAAIDKMEDARQALSAALETMNVHRGDFAEQLGDIVDRVQSEFDDKSDKWQEGEKAAAVTTWLEALTEAQEQLQNEIEVEVNVEFTIEPPDLDTPNLDEIPTEVEE